MRRAMTQRATRPVTLATLTRDSCRRCDIGLTDATSSESDDDDILTSSLDCVSSVVNQKRTLNVRAQRRKSVETIFRVCVFGVRRMVVVENGAETVFVYTNLCSCNARSCIRDFVAR